MTALYIAITHLSASERHHQDIATCTPEALAHFHDEFPGMIESFAFVGCCISERHLMGIQRLNRERHTRHRPVRKSIRVEENAYIIDLNIKQRDRV